MQTFLDALPLAKEKLMAARPQATARPVQTTNIVCPIKSQPIHLTRALTCGAEAIVLPPLPFDRADDMGQCRGLALCVLRRQRLGLLFRPQLDPTSIARCIPETRNTHQHVGTPIKILRAACLLLLQSM